MKKAIFLALSYFLIFVIGIYASYLVSFFDGPWFYESKKYNFPRTVIIEKHNKNNNLNAQILFDEETKNYFLALTSGNDTQVILTNKLVPSAAYHNPILKLSWLSPTLVGVTVDSDFGDNIREYIFDINNFTFREQHSNKALQPTAESGG